MSNFVLDGSIAPDGVLETLVSAFSSYKGDCFLICSPDTTMDDLEKRLSLFSWKPHYFICPKFNEKLQETSWKVNTIRALNPKIYIGVDEDVVSQARLLGVPSALYRL